MICVPGQPPVHESPSGASFSFAIPAAEVVAAGRRVASSGRPGMTDVWKSPPLTASSARSPFSRARVLPLFEYGGKFDVVVVIVQVVALHRIPAGPQPSVNDPVPACEILRTVPFSRIMREL